MPKASKKDTKLIQQKTKASVSNSLNEMFFEQKDMTLQAFRMFMFYLAKIDPQRPEFTEISVPLAEYAKMLGVELNEKAIDKSTDMLLGYVVKLEPKVSEDSEYEELSHKVQMFSQSKLLRRRKDGELLLTFKCHDELKPHIFNLQQKYTKITVWNILNLSNFQDMRMYMLLSQFKTVGERTIELSELKVMLGINKDAYSEYKEFARTVLKKCQKALKERTDICFEFKSIGRPAHSVYFEIFSNADYTILKYLNETEETKPLPAADEEKDDLVYGDGSIQMVMDIEDPLAHERGLREEICEGFQNTDFDEFTLDQLKEFRKLAAPHVDLEEVDRVDSWMHDRRAAYEKVLCDYVLSKVLYVNSEGADHSRLGYIRKAIVEDYR